MAGLDLALLLAILVITPLDLRLLAAPDRHGRYSLIQRALKYGYAPAAVLAVIAFGLPTGLGAGLLALGWFAFALAGALWGITRWLSRSASRLDELCLAVGGIYLAVGAGWLVVSRLGLAPLGFSASVVVLTAIHFHFVSLVALVQAAMVGRLLGPAQPMVRGAYRLSASGVMVAPILVATGISLAPTVELIGAVALAVGVAVVAALALRLVLAGPYRRAAKVLMLIAALSVLGSMSLAIIYALGIGLTGQRLTIAQMAGTHGLLNAVGFGLASLLAWNLIRPPARWPAAGVPFSRLASRGRVGPSFFQRVGAVSATKPPAHGLVDNLDEYSRPDFETGRIHLLIRSFYEETDAHGLLVYPDWHRGFRTPARWYKRLSEWLGQMNLPLDADSQEEVVESTLWPLDDGLDGRDQVRAWVRVYPKTGSAVYVAAYAHHSDGRQTYMNIAFPIPGGNITSVLRLTMLDEGRGLELTTLQPAEAVGDQGVYFANRLLPIRLPLDETIRVEVAPPDFERAAWKIPAGLPITLRAQHDMWLLGVPLLTLHYYIYREAAQR